MAHYIAERYLSRTDAEGLEAVIARARGAAGPDVSYVRTIYVPADETCFHEFVSNGEQSLRDALTRHSVPFDQLSEAVLEAFDARRALPATGST